ncbi:MAG TPA: hypothetical protein DCQ31_07595, partial [Bacteroidales bacterium]|nr:hypothetical protein [Bacteroidales bacterium]
MFEFIKQKKMKNNVLAFILLTISFSVSAQIDAEKDAIKKVIQESYIDGIQNLGDIETIRKGFHPAFVLLGVNANNQITQLPIYTWIEMVEQRKRENPNGLPPEKKVTCEFEFIDVTGTAAVAKFKFFVGG